MNTQIDIHKIFSNPIILDHYQNHCPNCCSFDIHCVENYERDGKHVSIFECNFCGAHWELEKLMKQEIKCRADRIWLGWEGKTTVNGETFRSGIIRYTKTEALMDAKRMKEELEMGSYPVLK